MSSILFLVFHIIICNPAALQLLVIKNMNREQYTPLLNYITG